MEGIEDGREFGREGMGVNRAKLISSLKVLSRAIIVSKHVVRKIIQSWALSSCEWEMITGVNL